MKYTQEVDWNVRQSGIGVCGRRLSGLRFLGDWFVGLWVPGFGEGMGFLFWNRTLLYNSSAWMHCIWGVGWVFGME